MTTLASADSASSAATTRSGVLIFFCALTSFALFDAFCKQMLETYSAPFMNLMRYSAVTVLALLWLARSSSSSSGSSGSVTQTDWRLWRTPHRGLLIWRSLMLGIVATCFMTALIWMPLAQATAIYFTAPLIMVAISPVLLGERVHATQWMAVIAGFAGMLLIVRPSADLPLLGTVLMAISAICYALFQVLTRKLSGLVAAPVQYAYMALICLIVTGLPALFVLPTPWPSWPQFALLLAGGFLNGLGHFLLLAAFRRVQASTLAPLNYIQLLLAVLISTFWFQQSPDAIAMGGIAMIMASGAYLALRRGTAPK